MNLDTIISHFSADEGKTPTDRQELVKSRFFQNKNKSHAYVLLPPWGQKLIFFAPLRKRILQKGDCLLEYEFVKGILTADCRLSLHYSRYIFNKIIKDLKNLKKGGIKQFTVIGTSVGSMVAIKTANHEPAVKKLILNTPGNCQAEIIWSSIRLRYIKKYLEKQGMSITKLKKLWEEMLPENNLDKLKGKELFINLSRADLVVPYANGQKLVGKMREIGLNPTVMENNNLGHYLTILKYYFSPNII